MTIEQFFARLAQARVVPELRSVTASYLYDIEGTGQWRVAVNRGAVEVDAGGGAADCTISAEADDFLDVVLGRRNPTTALMQGRVRFRGPIALLLNQPPLFRAGTRPPADESRDEVRP
jgi:putative sterol carrier protein